MLLQLLVELFGAPNLALLLCNLCLHLGALYVPRVAGSLVIVPFELEEAHHAYQIVSKRVADVAVAKESSEAYPATYTLCQRARWPRRQQRPRCSSRTETARPSRAGRSNFARNGSSGGGHAERCGFDVPSVVTSCRVSLAISGRALSKRAVAEGDERARTIGLRENEANGESARSKETRSVGGRGERGSALDRGSSCRSRRTERTCGSFEGPCALPTDSRQTSTLDHISPLPASSPPGPTLYTPHLQRPYRLPLSGRAVFPEVTVPIVKTRTMLSTFLTIQSDAVVTIERSSDASSSFPISPHSLARDLIIPERKASVQRYGFEKKEHQESRDSPLCCTQGLNLFDSLHRQPIPERPSGLLASIPINSQRWDCDMLLQWSRGPWRDVNYGKNFPAKAVDKRIVGRADFT